MERSIRILAIAMVMLAAVALSSAAWAQPGPGGPPNRPGFAPGGPGGPGGGFGGMGMGMGMMFRSPYSLLSADAVSKELGLTEDQQAQIRTINEKSQGGMRDMFGDFRDLSPEQRDKKMAEIREKSESRRKETNKAIEGVLSEKQTTRLKEIFVQLQGEQALRDAEIQETLGLSQEQKNMIRSPVEVLNADQKAAFEKMKGEKFDVGSIRMGPPGGSRRGEGRGQGGFGPGGQGRDGGERRRPAARKEAPKSE